MQKQYLGVAETAKLVRAALKKSFPAVKFSVRSESYAGGASINVGWTDGPTRNMVEAVAKQFAGGRFDGMIDMAYSVSHWMMPDGSIEIASNPGTTGSRGSHAPERNWMPHPEAKLVHFGANFVFCRRELSERFLRQACARMARAGYPEFKDAGITVTSYGTAYLTDHRKVLSACHGLDQDMGTMLHRECAKLVIA